MSPTRVRAGRGLFYVITAKAGIMGPKRRLKIIVPQTQAGFTALNANNG
jgi:hypothetical protein